MIKRMIGIIQRFIPFLPPEVVILPSLKNSIKTSSTIYFQTPIFYILDFYLMFPTKTKLKIILLYFELELKLFVF